MRSKRKLFTGGLLAMLAVAAIVFFGVVPGVVERSMNRVLPHAPYEVSVEARALHDTLFVSDLHADSLLWNRDLLARGRSGHVDIPRLIEGGVGLQVFGIVTKTPRNQNYDRNTGDSDNITLLAVAERWPPSSWFSLKRRALYQAAKLHRIAARSEGRLVVVESATDLVAFEKTRAHNRHMVAGILGVEGGQCLEGEVANLDRLFAAGIRLVGITHFFDNELGASAHGVSKTGLTELGNQAVRRMESLRMVIDLAHASPAVVDDVLQLATRPVIVSHTGMQATCPGPRNLSDDHARAIARTGGVIGIGYWDGAVCEPEIDNVVAAIRYTADLVGVDHVALGSDYDGATEVAWDASELVVLTDALLDNGFGEDDVRKIMGENALRVLEEILPQT